MTTAQVWEALAVVAGAVHVAASVVALVLLVAAGVVFARAAVGVERGR